MMQLHDNRDLSTLVPIGMVGLGVILILTQALGMAWYPLVVLGIGGSMLLLASSDEHKEATAWFAIPGMLTAGTGLILLVMEMLDHPLVWTYAWLLYGVFLGMSFLFVDAKLSNAETAELAPIGRAFIYYSGMVFLGAAFLVELIILGGFVRQMAVALLLIATGIYLVQRGDLSAEKPKRIEKAKRDHEFLMGNDGEVLQYGLTATPDLGEKLQRDDARWR